MSCLHVCVIISEGVESLLTTRVSGHAWDGEPHFARHAPSGGGRGPLAIRCDVDSRRMRHVGCDQNGNRMCMNCNRAMSFASYRRSNTMPFRVAFSRPAALIIVIIRYTQRKGKSALHTGQTMLVLVTPVGLISGHKTGFREGL